jgi:hypothetical protein
MSGLRHLELEEIFELYTAIHSYDFDKGTQMQVCVYICYVGPLTSPVFSQLYEAISDISPVLLRFTDNDVEFDRHQAPIDRISACRQRPVVQGRHRFDHPTALCD